MKIAAAALFFAVTVSAVIARPQPQDHLRSVRDATQTNECPLGASLESYEFDSDLEQSKSSHKILRHVYHVSYFSVVPRSSCKQWMDDYENATSGLYLVSPTGGCDYKVFCDLCLSNDAEEGWIIIQRREDDDIDFEDKSWDDYKTGFGNYLHSYWMGLEKMHQITSSGTYKLYVGIERYSGDLSDIWAVYNSFSVGSAAENYKLDLSGYDSASTAADGLWQYTNGMPFTTHDSDNDGESVNCANHSDMLFGGWWFGSTDNWATNLDNCLPGESNLNGKYGASGNNQIRWMSTTTSITKTIMAIRRS